VDNPPDVTNPKMIEYFWLAYTTDLETPAASWAKTGELVGVNRTTPFYVFDIAERLKDAEDDTKCFFKVYARHGIPVEEDVE